MGNMAKAISWPLTAHAPSIRCGTLLKLRQLDIGYQAVLLSLILVVIASGQESSVRLKKPQNIFFYPQLNLHGGYDTNEPGDHWGLADRGARTQLSLEWFVKDEIHQQRGFAKLIEPASWNMKFAVEIEPKEHQQERFDVRLRPLDTWVKFATKWDRTNLWLGHKSIPYGHNPRLDPSHAFMPNQAGLDLSFGRDTGIFAKTPVSNDLDLELSATMGKGDTWDYHGGWLLTSRVGSPTFKISEAGLFALGGKIQRTNGAATTNSDLTSVYRVGADWIYKHQELWKVVNQFSVGENRSGGDEDRFLLNMLNSFEWYAHPKWTLGATHSLRYEEPYGDRLSVQTKGALFGTLSYAVRRDVRLRINLLAEYHNSTGDRDTGVMLQLCFGCGLIR